VKVLETWSEDSAYTEMVKALETGRTYTTIPEWGDIEQILVVMFSAVWDQLEIPALYSDEKLYNIFMEYTEQINKRLGYKGTSVMTLAEFQALWKKILDTPNEADKPKEATTTDHIRNNLRIAPWLFAILFVFGFASAYKRKRKNKNYGCQRIQDNPDFQEHHFQEHRPLDSLHVADCHRGHCVLHAAPAQLDIRMEPQQQLQPAATGIDVCP
jgi:hypothetical protein